MSDAHNILAVMVLSFGLTFGISLWLGHGDPMDAAAIGGFLRAIWCLWERSIQR